MPFRKRRAFTRSRTRRRTRWLSIVPDDFTINNDDTYAHQQVELQDAEGAVSWSEFYGGTLLKVIMNYTYQPVYGVATGTGSSRMHLGLFMLPDELASQAQWDPNTPSGSFMLRWTADLWVQAILDTAVELSWSLGPRPYSNGPSNEVETAVKRRITENDKLFISGHGFFSGLVTNNVIGYVGRVLIALP